MPDWDANSPALRANLSNVLRSVRDSARRRDVPGVESARAWQRQTMAGLDVPDARYVGAFRGEPGLEDVEVRIGAHRGVQAEKVAEELRTFERRIRRAVELLDQRFAPDAELNEEGLGDVIELAAWAHAEWVRIHPFANGNGRTARLWANFVFMRYGI